MNRFHLLLVTAVLGAIGRLPMHAQAPSPRPFDVALTINEGGSDTVYRGWPLLFRGDAVLMEDVAAPFPLDLESLTLAIAPVQGPAVPWPLRRVTEFSSAPTL